MPLPLAIPLALKALPWRLIGIVVGAVVLVGVVWWRIDAYGDAKYDAGEMAGKKEIQDLWDADKLAWADKLNQKAAEYRAAETQLRAHADAANAEGKAREARISASLSLALDQLRRDRNARPGGDGGPPPAAAVAADGRAGTCSGRELYFNDAAVLGRVAAQLERDRGHLRQCIRQYNAARDALTPPKE